MKHFFSSTGHPRIVRSVLLALMSASGMLWLTTASTLAQDPIPTRITVLTYNTHLFGTPKSVISSGQIAALVRKAQGKAPLIFEDEQRAPEIVNRLRQRRADVVALQEVWAYNLQTWFCNRLKDVYPYCYHPPYFGNRPETSGLVLLSKFKLMSQQFAQFETKPTNDDDKLARKGVITATVEMSDGVRFRVGASHAHTTSVQPNIKQIADRTANARGVRLDAPAIMMGDFNISLEGTSYEAMKSTFADVGAVDAYRKVRPQIGENDYTADVPSNALHAVFNPVKTGEPHGAPRCIDYVFVKQSGGGLELTPVKAEVIQDWKYARKKGPADLSDHYPVEVTFQVVTRTASGQR